MFVCCEVLTCEPIASSNGKAKKVSVNAGSEHGELCIVTNAPNIRQGTHTVVALLGSTVTDEHGEEITLKEVKVYGVTSQGMICDSGMLNWSGGAKGVCVQVPPADFPPGSTPPASKPRLGGGDDRKKEEEAEEVILSPKEIKALEKERKKKEKALLKASGGGSESGSGKKSTKQEERERKRAEKNALKAYGDGEKVCKEEEEDGKVEHIFSALTVNDKQSDVVNNSTTTTTTTTAATTLFRNKKEMCLHLMELYTTHGNNDYIGEPVSILEHSLQAAFLAAEGIFIIKDIDHIISGVDAAGGEKEVDECLILGCLLHDLGHILGLQMEMQAKENGAEVPEQMDGCGTMHHESLGADFLSQQCGLDTHIASYVHHHVNAKRYLCYKRNAYYTMLSDASKTTLEFQGGIMSEQEAINFENEPNFWKILHMRKIDERAKVVGKVVPGLESYFDLLKKYCSLPEE